MNLKAYWNIAKTLLKIKSEVSKMNADKPAWRSTAGLLNIISLIVTAFAGFQGILSAELAAKILAGLVMVFTVSNAIVKFTPSKKDDEFLEKVRELIESKLKGQNLPK